MNESFKHFEEAWGRDLVWKTFDSAYASVHIWRHVCWKLCNTWKQMTASH